MFSSTLKSGKVIYSSHESTFEKRWYALYCKSRHEKKAHVRLQAKGITSYLSDYETRVKWGTRMRKVRKNLLPGYLLVHASLNPRTHLDILQTEGIVKLVGKQWPDLSWIPDEQVKSLQMILRSHEEFEEVEYLSAGERVEVIAGPFAGLRGLVAERSSRHNRVAVSLHLLKRSVAVEIDTTLLRKLPPHAARLVA